jgi:hypothetical protein
LREATTYEKPIVGQRIALKQSLLLGTINNAVVILGIYVIKLDDSESLIRLRNGEFYCLSEFPPAHISGNDFADQVIVRQMDLGLKLIEISPNLSEEQVQLIEKNMINCQKQLNLLIDKDNFVYMLLENESKPHVVKVVHEFIFKHYIELQPKLLNLGKNHPQTAVEAMLYNATRLEKCNAAIKHNKT